MAIAFFILLAWAVPPVACSDNDSQQQGLEKAVDQLRNQGSISKRRQIDTFYELARLYASKGDIENAVRIFEEALQVDSANLEKQMEYARLLIKLDKKNTAANRILDIYRFAEDESLIRESKQLLNDLRVELPVPEDETSINNHIEIKLIPVGDPNPQVMKELAAALKREIKVDVLISNRSVALGAYDRRMDELFIQDYFEAIKKRLNERQYHFLAVQVGMLSSDTPSIKDQKDFIHEYFNQFGVDGFQMARKFDEECLRLEKRGQYIELNLIDRIRDAFPFGEMDRVKSYIGVTSESLTCKDCRSLFGGTDGGIYGVISYYDFTAQKNGEQPNRPRLVNRLLKQALSSINFTFGIPRCHTPHCARSFPLSLADHDAKSNALCDICTSRLSAFKKDPRSRNFAIEYIDLGRHYISVSKWDKAIAAYEKFLKEDTIISREAHEGIGVAYYHKGNPEKALAAYHKALKLDSPSEDPELFFKIAKIYRETGQFDKEIETYKTALEFKPGDPVLLEMLGICYQKRGQKQSAAAAYEQSIKANPDRSSVHYNLAVVLNESITDKNKVIFHLQQAISLNPEFFHSYQILGRIYGQSGEPDKAIDTFTSALKIEPENSDVLNSLGYTWFIKKNYEKAIAHYEKALLYNPEYGLAHYNKAMVHYALKQFQKAVFHYDKAVNHDYPGSPRFKAAIDHHRL